MTTSMHVHVQQVSQTPGQLSVLASTYVVLSSKIILFRPPPAQILTPTRSPLHNTTKAAPQPTCFRSSTLFTRRSGSPKIPSRAAHPTPHPSSPILKLVTLPMFHHLHPPPRNPPNHARPHVSQIRAAEQRKTKEGGDLEARVPEHVNARRNPQPSVRSAAADPRLAVWLPTLPYVPLH
ncbi:hypothetical protein DXG01_007487 [Tephrocybe rancida]|nr:hypothetical protein DXG01_007487 [Tephrocybe rancida]